MATRLPLAAAAISLVLAAVPSGCSAGYAADADREVGHLLALRREQVLGNRRAEVERPEPAREAPAPRPGQQPEPQPQPPPDAPAGAAAGEPGTEPLRIGLEQALVLAVQNNRDYQSRREGLYQQGLSLSLTREQFGPLYRSAVGHSWSDQEGGLGRHRTAGTLGASQILPTGGEVSFGGELGSSWFDGSSGSLGTDGSFFDSSVQLLVRQPLLRGFGYEASHEPLTQAERSMVYAVRDFELFREGFSITVAQAFFDLVSQQQTLANEEANLRQAVFDRRQAEALLQVDRNTEVEVYRARRREIDAENRLLDARATFERARDQFKILLGMTTALPIEIVESEPPFEAVRYDPQSAVTAAIRNRLDLRTQRERIVDAERAVRIAENATLPDLNLNLNLGMTGDTDSSLAQAAPDRWNAGASVLFELPLQPKAERNALRSSQLALDQARRDYTLALDEIELEIKNQLRNLHSLEQQIELQRDQIEQERRAVAVTEIRYEAGDLDNRDLLEARQALFNARNTLIRLKVDHFIARLRLLRDLGLLFVDDLGRWE